MMFQPVCLPVIVRMVNTRVCNGFSFAVTKTESRTRVGTVTFIRQSRLDFNE